MEQATVVLTTDGQGLCSGAGNGQALFDQQLPSRQRNGPGDPVGKQDLVTQHGIGDRLSQAAGSAVIEIRNRNRAGAHHPREQQEN